MQGLSSVSNTGSWQPSQETKEAMQAVRQWLADEAEVCVGVGGGTGQCPAYTGAGAGHTVKPMAGHVLGCMTGVLYVLAAPNTNGWIACVATCVSAVGLLALPSDLTDPAWTNCKPPGTPASASPKTTLTPHAHLQRPCTV